MQHLEKDTHNFFLYNTTEWLRKRNILRLISNKSKKSIFQTKFIKISFIRKKFTSNNEWPNFYSKYFDNFWHAIYIQWYDRIVYISLQVEHELIRKRDILCILKATHKNPHDYKIMEHTTFTFFTNVQCVCPSVLWKWTSVKSIFENGLCSPVFHDTTVSPLRTTFSMEFLYTCTAKCVL